jgi:hypothetical protein
MVPLILVSKQLIFLESIKAYKPKEFEMKNNEKFDYRRGIK